MIKQLKVILDENEIKYDLLVNLQKKTWIHRGGTADIFITPSNVLELKLVCSYLYKNNIHFLLLGHTSNIYIKNTCNIPVVVSTILCKSYTVASDFIYCEAGVGVINFSKSMIKLGLSGFEYLTGLPGTVGAALINNSSCKSNSISDLLISADILLSTGEIKTFLPNDFSFSYRSSIFKRGEIQGCILSVKLKKNHGNVDDLKCISNINKEDRTKRLEGHARNLGCVFDNPYSLGPMSLKYKLPMLLIRIWAKIFRLSKENTNLCINKVLCKLSGCMDALPYISKKNPIIYLWLDDGADISFDTYCRFMEKVYKTNKLEIQIIE